MMMMMMDDPFSSPFFFLPVILLQKSSSHTRIRIFNMGKINKDGGHIERLQVLQLIHVRKGVVVALGMVHKRRVDILITAHTHTHILVSYRRSRSSCIESLHTSPRTFRMHP